MVISLLTFCFQSSDDAMITQLMKSGKETQNFHPYEIFQTVFTLENLDLLIYLKGNLLNREAGHTQSEEAGSWWLALTGGLLYHPLPRIASTWC